MAKTSLPGLVTARKAAGLTQTKLAAKLGVTAVTVSNWESGRSRPPLRTLVAVAAALATTTEQLLNDPA